MSSLIARASLTSAPQLVSSGIDSCDHQQCAVTTVTLPPNVVCGGVQDQPTLDIFTNTARLAHLATAACNLDHQLWYLACASRDSAQRPHSIDDTTSPKTSHATLAQPLHHPCTQTSGNNRPPMRAVSYCAAIR